MFAARALSMAGMLAIACQPAVAQAPAAQPGPAPDAGDGPVFIRPATIDNSLEVTGEAIAARQINTRMLIGVNVNGKGPFRFFVDSGADRSVIGAMLAARLALPTGPAVILHSTGGSHLIDTVRIDSLQVGGSEIHDIAAPALPERFLGADGMVGIDALADQRLTLDFDRKTVTVQDTRRAMRAAGPDEVIVTARRRKGQLILTQAFAGVPIAAVIDTGTEITVGNDALRTRLLRNRRAPPMRTTLLSVTGDAILVDLLPVAEIRIGDLVVHNVLIAFSDIAPFKLFGLDREPAMLLGTDILHNFRRVSLDFRHRKVRFTLRPGSPFGRY